MNIIGIVRKNELAIRRFQETHHYKDNEILYLIRTRLGGEVVQPLAFSVLKLAGLEEQIQPDTDPIESNEVLLSV